MTWRRVRQFAATVRARLTDDDRAFVREHLSPDLLALFEAMPVAEQAHGLSVARTILASEHIYNVGNVTLLMRCALLHDAGKRYPWRGNVAVAVCKTLAVVGEWLGVRHRRNHAVHGALLLRDLGYDDLADIVAHHHDTRSRTDGGLLKILQEADERN